MLERKRTGSNVVDMAPVRQRDLDAEAMPVVGMRIEKARLAKDWDLEALTHFSRNKYSALRAYERGQRIPNAFAGVRLADALGIDVRDLFAPPTQAELTELARRDKEPKKKKARKKAA